MGRKLKIGRSEYSVDAMRSRTEDEALKAYENHPTIKPDDVKKAWKCCNGYSKPNHLKDQLEGLKPVKKEKPADKKNKNKKEPEKEN